jgi:isoleucyl-tRNA synthetase
MFKSVSSKLNINEMELTVLKFWKEKNIFKRVTETRQGGPEFVFFEGPPTANGRPGVHHGLARSFKDMFPRYRVMNGYHVIRRGGWDTHGLPVEIEVEKKLGFTNKGQIEEYGIDKFNQLCRQSVFDYIQDWEKFTDRLGFWVDLDTAYVTFTNDYIESVWSILKNFYDRDLLYQGYKVVPYCPRCGTPLSDHEVAQGYADAEDPSIFVRFPLMDEPGTSLLVWTTTPWTLPGNVAVAAHPEEDYVKIERDTGENGTEKLILGKKLLEKIFVDEEVKTLETFKGKKLKGLKYKPLFTFLPTDKDAYYVVLQEYVTMEDGTGLVHTAPAFGGEDMDAALEFDLPVLMTVKEDGTFIQEVRPWSGKFVKDADQEIIQDLENRGLMFRVGTYTHTYPFCWRCDTPLLYYARGTWFIRTSQFKDKLVQYNRQVNWVPEHIKEGRFGNWLENNIDWSLGRERYWGTPLPIWECQDCHNQECVGSVGQLSQFAGCDLSELDLHRPFVDEVTFNCQECGGQMHRVPELIDVWFDSGSMPYGQWHYPFENQEIFKTQFPADFICEAVDQTRGWFYSLHAISTLYMDSLCFKNVICHGHVLGEDGRSMSKSRGTAVDPWDVLNNQGADAFRWYLYTASPPENARRFSAKLVEEVVKNFTLTLWNVYSFFVTYANLDGWTPDPKVKPEYTPMDRWLLSSLHALIRNVTDSMENYDVLGSTRPIEDFVNTLSKWYLRRSRRRFWKSESDSDKHAAYAALYEALVKVTYLLAPTMPFISEDLYQNLVRAVHKDAPESVHMAQWPEYDPTMIDEDLNRDMALVMRLTSLGHAARNKAEIKVRQPLSEVAFSVGSAQEARVVEAYTEVLAEELNVKQVRLLTQTGEVVSYSLNPLPRQLGSKYKELFPEIRKALLEMNLDEAVAKLLGEESVQVNVGGKTLEILPDEVEVRAEAKTGMTVSQEGAYLAAIKTDLTDDLIAEGLAREFVRRVQDFRKQAGFDIADRIRLYYSASVKLTKAIEAHREYIMGEVLATQIEDKKPTKKAQCPDEMFQFEGEEVTIGIMKN